MATSNGAKAFGSIVAIGVVIAVQVALWQAQTSSLETLERLTDQRLGQIEKTMAAHGVLFNKDDERERVDAAAIAKISEQFTEVQTKFNALREISDIRGVNETAAIDKLENWVRALEREVWTGIPPHGATP